MSSYSYLDPRAGFAMVVARPNPGLGNVAELRLMDVTPGSMAESRVPRSNQLLMGSNQQSSRPLGRLLWGCWTTTHGHFRA